MDAISGCSGMAGQNFSSVGKMGGLLKDAVALEGEMALQLLQVNLQNQVATEQMNLTQQVVDMYV